MAAACLWPFPTPAKDAHRHVSEKARFLASRAGRASRTPNDCFCNCRPVSFLDNKQHGSDPESVRLAVSKNLLLTHILPGLVCEAYADFRTGMKRSHGATLCSSNVVSLPTLSSVRRASVVMEVYRCSSVCFLVISEKQESPDLLPRNVATGRA